MKKTSQIIGVVALSLGCFVGSAMAVPTAIELGYSDPGSPADPNAETSRLISLIAGYNLGESGSISSSLFIVPGAGLPSAPLPDVGTNIGQNSGGGGVQTGLSVDLGVGGYDYVMVKWGDTSEYYYIGGDSGTITVNNDVNGNGESHYDLFTPGTTTAVPDNGSTLVLLGVAMIGMVVASRMFRPAAVRS